MRIEVLRGPGGPGRRLGEEAEHGGLLRELAARGFEVVPRGPEVSAPGAAPLLPDDSAEPAGRDAAAAVPASGGGVAPAPPAPEALLLCGRAEEPAGDCAIAGWLEAARNAARAGRPVVLTGLVVDDADEPAEGLAELLATAALVGLRDEASLERARRMCPRHPALWLGRDDLLVLPPLATPPPARGKEPTIPPRERDQDPTSGVEPPRLVAAVGRPAGPFSPGEAAPVLAALLDALVHRTGGTVTLLPRTDSAVDADFTAAVAALLPGDVPRRQVDFGPAADAVVGTADRLVTTGRNAVALGLAGRADVLPIAADEYSRHRMDSVLEHWGMAGHAVPLAALLTPGDAAWDTRAAVQQWAAEALEHREAVRAAVTAAEPGLRAASALWWDAVADTLRGGCPHRPGGGTTSPVDAAPVVRALRCRYTVPAVPAARPTVAVVLRVPGGSVAPERALEDLLAQTFTDWRLVVVEDGGDPAAVAALLERHSRRLAGRATTLHHQRALGPGAAANRGLRAGNSEFMVLHDPHQPWHPVLLQAAVAHLENPLVTDDGVLVSAQGPPPAAGPDGTDESRDGTAPPLALADVLDGAPASPGTLVYRRAVHGVLGDYDETLAAAEWEFALRLLETFTVGRLPARPLPVAERTGGRLRDRDRDELLVRERHLRQWTAEHGIGLPLYISRAVERRTERLAERLDASQALTRELLDVVRTQSTQLDRLERAVAEKGFAAFCRRLWRRLRGR